MKKPLVLGISIVVLVSTMGCFNGGIIDDSYVPIISVMFSNPVITFVQGDQSFFDAQVDVLKITPREGKVKWEDVTIRVRDPNGDLIRSNVSLYPLGQSAESGFNAQYSDTVTEDVLITRNETLHFLNLDEIFAGNKLILINKGNMIGTVFIPSKVVKFTFSSVKERIYSGASWYSVNYTISYVFCPGTELGWDDCQVEKRQLNGVYEFIPFESYPIVNGSGIAAWYLDMQGQDDINDEGDVVTITGLSIAYQDGYVRLSHDQDSIGTIQLPSDFT